MLFLVLYCYLEYQICTLICLCAQTLMYNCFRNQCQLCGMLDDPSLTHDATFSVCTYVLISFCKDRPVPYILPQQPPPVLFGGTVNLTCASYGKGPFTMTWMNGDIELISASPVYMLVLVVNLTSLENCTDYTCTVQNEAGPNLASVTVQQER